MTGTVYRSAILQILLSVVAIAQFPPLPRDVNTVDSKLWPGASITYKETFICETTPGVHSYAGHVHLPDTILSPIQATPTNISTFFWFFESRTDPQNSPLAIWLGGGPGESALDGTFMENGPCYVDDDGLTTSLNDYSLNSVANVIYIDQPSTVGFSYQELMQGTLNQISKDSINIVEGTETVKPESMTHLAGIFPRQDMDKVVNSTDTAARILWHVVQEFTAEFPHYNTQDKRISLFSNSYGGYFGPATFDHFIQQNALLFTANITDPDCEPNPVNTGTSDPLSSAHYLHLDTLGFTNGCIDLEAQALSWPEFAFKNTYNHPIINETVYNTVLDRIHKPDEGCFALIQKCKALAATNDPLDFATDNTTNTACAAAQNCMADIVLGEANSLGGHHAFDISQRTPSSYPPNNHISYLNSLPVQNALGVPLNWTIDSTAVQTAFFASGDDARQDMSHLQRVLDAGVKVAMVYGDLDHRCNWLGGENVSLSVPFSGRDEFNAAGYAPVQLDGEAAPGVVRQSGGFSFTRMFQAGHMVGFYKPRATLEVFIRAMRGVDVATGKVAVSGEYATVGPRDSRDVDGVGNSTLPESHGVRCNVWSIATSCTEEQMQALEMGTAKLDGFFVAEPAGEWAPED